MTNTTRRPPVSELSHELGLRMERLCGTLVGEKPVARTRTQLRFFNNNGLSVEIGGPKRGIWCDFRGGENVGGDAVDLVVHLRRCSMADAIEWATAWLGMPSSSPSAAAPAPAREDDDAAAKLQAAALIWNEAGDAADTPAEKALHRRKVRLPASGVIRYHPRCPCGRDRLPAMVAAMTNPITGEFCGILRTFLATDGSKAPITAPRRMLGHAGAIRLSPDEDVTHALGLVEGIENGLTVLQAVGWAPVWAAGSAGSIANFPVLPGIEVLTIFADADKAGVRAARACATRWTGAGREVCIIPPRQNGADWNDVGRVIAA